MAWFPHTRPPLAAPDSRQSCPSGQKQPPKRSQWKSHLPPAPSASAEPSTRISSVLSPSHPHPAPGHFFQKEKLCPWRELSTLGEGTVLRGAAGPLRAEGPAPAGTCPASGVGHIGIVSCQLLRPGLGLVPGVRATGQAPAPLPSGLRLVPCSKCQVRTLSVHAWGTARAWEARTPPLRVVIWSPGLEP